MLQIAGITLIILLLLGIPITFALLGSGLLAVLLTNGFSDYVIIERFIAGINSFSLMAIPLFVAGGAIMNAGGISKHIVNFCSSLLSWLRGGLGCVCVGSNMIFGGISGSGVAAVSAIGSITAPALEKAGYSKGFIGGLIGGAGAVAPIIPPSCDMIVFASITGLSVARIFMGGMVPGICIGIVMMVICVLYARKHNIDYGGKFVLVNVWKAFKEAIWALLMPVIIIGGVAAGFCTATEAGAVACVYGLIVGKFVYKELTFKKVIESLRGSVVINGQIMTLIGASSLYGYIFAVQNVSATLRSFLGGISANPTVIMLIVAAIILCIGCFMECTGVMPIILPIVYPLLESMGCNMVQFGVVFCMCTIIGGLTPPVGCYLFVSASVVKEKITKIIPWIMVMMSVILFFMLLSLFWEPFATFLPTMIYS